MSVNSMTALMTKLQLLYGNQEGSFLSFQYPGLAISPRDLGFQRPGEVGLSEQDALHAEALFSRLTNFIPGVSSIWTSDQRVLWDEYRTVLTQAVVANPVRTPQEEKELEEAYRVLFSNRQQIPYVESPEYAAYQRYEVDYINARKDYDAAKLTAENSDDPNALKQWKQNEPALKEKVKDAEDDWITKGFKSKIEEALADIRRIEGRNPQIEWGKWLDQLERSQKTDLIENQDFFQSSFYPTDFWKQKWLTLRLDANEIRKLCVKAPGDISNLEGNIGNTTDVEMSSPDIEALSVELSLVKLMRPWLQESIFRNRGWKWPDAREPLSDGLAPAKGVLVAYSTEMLLARNLEIKLKSNSTQNQEIARKLQESKKLILFGPFQLKPISPNIDPKTVSKFNSKAVNLWALKRVNPGVVDHVVVNKANLKLSSAALDLLAPKKAAAPSKLVTKTPIVTVGTRPVTVSVNMGPFLQAKLTTQTTPAESSTASEDMQIIAYLCQKVPKSPNPDPGTSWD